MTSKSDPRSLTLRKIDRADKRVKKAGIIISYDPEIKPGAVTNVQVKIRVREKRRQITYKARVTWDPTPQGVCEADIDHYDVQLRPRIKSGNSFTEPEGDGAHIKREHVFIEDFDQEDLDNKLAATFTHLEHPKRWYWQARVRVTDKDNRTGAWSSWTDPILPEAAAHPSPPPPDNLRMEFKEVEIRGEERYRLLVKFDEVGPWDIPPSDNDKEDVQDPEDDVKRYHIRLARVDPFDLQDVPANRYRQLSEPRDKFVPSKPEEEDAGDTVTFKFTNIRQKAWYQFKVRSIDRFGREGRWSSWTDPGSVTDVRNPPPPEAFHFDIDNNKFILDWFSPVDVNDNDTTLKDLHKNISYYQGQIATSPSFGNTIVKQDRHMTGEHKVFNVKRPSGTYFARIRSVDASGNKSGWSDIKSVNTKIPPKPETTSNPLTTERPSVTKDKYEAQKGNKFRAIVRFRYDPERYQEEHIDRYNVQLQIADKEAGFNSEEPDRRAKVDDDEEKRVVFSRIKAKYWVRARFRAVDRQGRKSPWSDWSDKVQMTDTAKPNTPQRVRRGKKGNRQVTIQWDHSQDRDDPTIPDRHTQHYHVQLSSDKTFSAIVDEDKEVVGARARFIVDDNSVRHWARVASVDEEGNYSDWIYDTTTQLPPGTYDDGQAGLQLQTQDLEDDVITVDKLRADALNVTGKLKSFVIEGNIIRTSGSGTNRITLKNIEGEQDRISWINFNNVTVGYMQTRSGDVFGSGDFAFQGIQFSNNYSGFPSFNGWARPYLDSGDIYVAIRRYDGTTQRKKLAWLSDVDDAKGHTHDAYALESHPHPGYEDRISQLETTIANKAWQNHSHGQHRHDISQANDGHAHGQFTGYKEVQ